MIILEKTKRFIKENYHFISLAAIFLVVTGILWHGGYQNDDYTYMQAAVCDFPKILSFMNFHFHECNGRNLVHFLVILFLRYKWELYVWRIICAAAVSIVCYSLGRLSSQEKAVQKRNTVLCCILYFAANPNIWRLAVCWLTGSFNYLLPFALLTVLLVRYSKKDNIDALCIICALLCGATTEQVGIMAVGFFVLMIINDYIRAKRVKRKNSVYFIASGLGYSTIWLSPGTSARSKYYSLYENNNVLRNAAHLLKLNWFENTGIVIFNAIIVAVLAFWLFRLKSKNQAVNIAQRIAAVGIILLGAGNLLFTAVIYCFGYNVGIDSMINKIIFALWLLNVIFVIGAMIYIAVVLYIRGESDIFIISVILGIGDQFMLILVYDNYYRTMFPSLFAFMMIILITANEFFNIKPFTEAKVISVLLVLVLVFGTGHYIIGKDSIRSQTPSSGCDTSLLDENGNVKPLSDEELERYYQWLLNSLPNSQSQQSERKDIRDFSGIPAVNKYNSR